MTPVSSASDFAEILRPIASLSWPCVAALFLYLFRKDISTLMARIRRAKAAGADLELDKALTDVQQRTEVAAQSVRGEPDEVATDEERSRERPFMQRIAEELHRQGMAPVRAESSAESIGGYS